jgi:hypothetical protein
MQSDTIKRRLKLSYQSTNSGANTSETRKVKRVKLTHSHYAASEATESVN